MTFARVALGRADTVRLRPMEGSPWRGSAEDDSDVMGLPVIDEPDAEIAGEADAVDLH
jgi:hypothetical protein